jgi:hypothetical protein
MGNGFNHKNQQISLEAIIFFPNRMQPYASQVQSCTSYIDAKTFNPSSPSYNK